MTSSLATGSATGLASFVEAGRVATPTDLQAKAARNGAVTCTVNTPRFRSVHIAERFMSVRSGGCAVVRARRNARELTQEREARGPRRTA